MLERAHQSLGPRPPPGAPPCPVIAKLLNCRDRDSALRWARKLGELQYEGSAISLYPDFTARVQEARRLFNPLKRQLRDHNVSYAMLYLAKLRVNLDGSSRIFTDPKTLQKAMKDLLKKSQQEPAREHTTALVEGAQGGSLENND